ncbi:MAG: MBL fold metallo-hydrolase [Planctomycetes bacterium]|nr:MBL fold metallo-hydrolase [Planctomycetota bacterium]NUQ34964.1 MBL fold metallo-hydrolase [Planctomycetaceae bacterium]
MKLKFWGVRGSLPSPSPTTVQFGGNTTCLQIIRDKGPTIIIDSGTGIRMLGESLMRNPGPPFDIKILVTHTHWDHIHGFPFFIPIYIPGGHIDVYGVGPIHQGVSFEKVMRDQMTYSYFPVENTMVDGVVHYHDFHEMFASRPSGVEGDYDLCEGVKLKLKLMNHPVYCVGYRIEADGKSIIFTGDHEPYYDAFAGQAGSDDEADADGTREFVDLMNQRFIDFCSGVDLLVIDTTYTEAEYFSAAKPHMSKKGWGHGYFEWSFDVAKKAGVKKLAFTHHDPTRSDIALFELEEKWRRIAKEQNVNFECFCAREGMEVDLDKPVVLPVRPQTAPVTVS